MSGLRIPGFCGLVLLATMSASAQQAGEAPRATASVASPVRAAVPRVLPGTVESAFCNIKGNAIDSSGKKLSHFGVRLRDASFGRIVDRQVTDITGLFAFRPVDPGPYVVELLGIADSVLAASDLLSVGAGESVSVVVELPLGISPYASLIGHGDPHAAALMGAAGNSGVLASQVTGADASAR
jgi:hypothetical protein